ncbi:MAG: helix-turn-helix domain-containing protein [Faecalibacterium sp.]|nr:helix-turn-helix domain-containing protein [Ruminococcus sp.]MCM1484575.1 helix-turn-helix domain-containing protein [Faecalibacterium sp.]
MEKTTIGKFIAQLRKESGMTQKQLAEKLNVSDKTISHWERDESSPDLSMIPIIADIFDVTCDELLRGEKNNSEPTVTDENEPAPPSKSIPPIDDIVDNVIDKTESLIKNIFSKGMTTHKILCTVACGIICLALFRAEIFAIQMGNMGGISDMLGSFGFAFFFSICIYYVISAVIIGVSHARLKGKIADDDSDEAAQEKQKLQMNRITAYASIFLILVFITTLVQIITADILSYPASLLILVPFDIIAASITVVLLKHFNKIANKQQGKRAKANFKFRLRAIVLALVFIGCGIGGQILFGIYKDKTYETSPHFLTAERFKEYMEIPKPIPAEYKGTLTERDNSGEAEVRRLEQEECYAYDPDTGDVLVSFKWLNHEVKSYEIIHEDWMDTELNYIDDDGESIYEVRKNYVFQVKTYMSEQSNKKLSLIEDIIYYAAFVYYPAIVIVCIIVCIVVPKRRRRKE